MGTGRAGSKASSGGDQDDHDVCDDQEDDNVDEVEDEDVLEEKIGVVEELEARLRLEVIRIRIMMISPSHHR